MHFKGFLTPSGLRLCWHAWFAPSQFAALTRGAAKIASVACIFLILSKVSLGQCTTYTPNAENFPYSYPATQVVSGTSTAPDGTVTPFSVTQTVNYSIVSPYDFAYVLGANRDNAFTVCSGEPSFSGSGSGTVAPSAQTNFYTNNVSTQVANGTLTIAASGTRTQPPNDGNTYSSFYAQYAETLVYSVTTGSFDLTETDSSASNYCCDSSGDLISINETGSAHALGTWDFIPTTHGYSLAQKQNWARLAESTLQKAAYWDEVYLECKQMTAGEPRSDPTAANCNYDLFLMISTTLAGVVLDKQAGDPPDPNYKSIAQPITPTFPLPRTNASWTAPQLAAAEAFKEYIQTAERIIGLSHAGVTSANRAEGARDAGDSYWEQQQVAALQRYADLEAFDLELMLPQITQLSHAYAHSGFPDFTVSSEQAIQFEEGIATNGLDPSLQQSLLAFGLDSADISSVAQAWSSFDPNTISGDFLANLAMPTSTVQQLAASFVFPLSPFSPKVDIFETSIFNTTFYAFQLAAPFGLSNATTEIDPIKQDVSFSLGTFALTIPAGSFHKDRWDGDDYRFSGIINGVSVLSIITSTPTGYQLRVDGFGIGRTSLPDLTNPISVTVQIGNNGSTTEVSAMLHGST